MNLKYLIIFVIGICLLTTGCQNPLSKNPVIGIIKNLSGSIKYYPGGSEDFILLQIVISMTDHCSPWICLN